MPASSRKQIQDLSNKIDTRLTSLDNKMDSTDKKLETVSVTLEEVQTQISNLKKAMELMATKFAEFHSQKTKTGTKNKESK